MTARILLIPGKRAVIDRAYSRSSIKFRRVALQALCAKLSCPPREVERMLDWTGERFVPWVEEAAVAYEHLHRYFWAGGLVQGKTVLDLACGEGYGSKILAQSAQSVIGIDIDPAAVRHASEKYVSSNLQFIQGSITNVPIADAGSFDVIVCFEAIEHIEAHDALLAEVKRLLKQDGLFVVSTPNKAVYRDHSEEHNPFHVKELSFDEFNVLLTGNFAHVRYFGQSVLPASSMWAIPPDGIAIREFPVERGPTEFHSISGDQRVPTYFIAMASDARQPLVQNAALGGVLIDHSNELVEALNREKTAADQSAQEAIRWQEQRLRELTGDVEWLRGTVKDLEQKIVSGEEALAWRAHQVDDLQKESEVLKSHLQSTQQQLGATSQELESIKVSRGWKAIVKIREVRNRLGLGKRS